MNLEKNRKELGKRLAQERKRLGLTQEQFGELGGVKKLSQFFYEKGDRPATTDYMLLLGTAGVDITYLLTGKSGPVAPAPHRAAYLNAALAVYATLESVNDLDGQRIKLDKRLKMFKSLFQHIAGSHPSFDAIGELPRIAQAIK